MKNFPLFLCLVLTLTGSTPHLVADVTADWAQVLLLDAGPKAAVNSPEQLKIATLEHLEQQEKVLREFISKYPDDTHTFSAYLRLAHLLAVRSNLRANEQDWAAAVKVLDELESRTADDSLSDVAFARISLAMLHLKPGDSNAGDALVEKAQKFQQDYPKDRRVARLLAELATLYDEQPAKKESLLQQARVVAVDEETRKRIEDDLKRISFLDKALDLQFTSLEGKSINLKDYRGKVVFVVFFAQWSPPSLKALEGIQAALKRFPQAAALGISLDNDPKQLASYAKAHALNWPLSCDGQGWKSPLARSFGINSLPTVWLVDSTGTLKRLNVRHDWEDAIRQAQ